MRKAVDFLAATLIILAVLIALNTSFVPIRLGLNDLGATGVLYWIGILLSLFLLPIVAPVAFIAALINHPGKVGFSIIFFIFALLIGALGLRLLKAK